MSGPTRKHPLWISCTFLYKYRLLLLTFEFIIISKSIPHTLKLQYMSIITPLLHATFKQASRTGMRQGTLEIVIEEVLWWVRGSYQTIWSFPLTNVKWHSVTRPYTMITPYWSYFVPNSTFYRFLSGFHRTFATSVACEQETLTPPDTWSRPFWTCICSTCWNQSFSWTCRYFCGLCSSNIPRYFLNFAPYLNFLEIVVFVDVKRCR